MCTWKNWGVIGIQASYGTSFTTRLKSVGPRIAPWGTPLPNKMSLKRLLFTRARNSIYLQILYLQKNFLKLVLAFFSENLDLSGSSKILWQTLTHFEKGGRSLVSMFFMRFLGHKYIFKKKNFFSGMQKSVLFSHDRFYRFRYDSFGIEKRII